MRAPLILAPIALALTFGTAAARSVTVDHHDLNLARPADSQELDRRLKRAARVACADAGDRGAKAAVDYARCLTTAMADAQAAKQAKLDQRSMPALAAATPR